MANLLDRSSLVLTPTAYNNGEALCIKPDDASGDFQFSRNSAATRVNAQGLVENVQILSSNLVQNGDFSEEGAEEVSNGSFSQEGAELVTNGSFDADSNWNKQTSNWTISNGYAVCDGLQTTNSSLFQDLAVVNGNSYRIDFTITDSANDLNLILGATTIGQYGDGTHTVYVEKDSGGARVFFQATASNAFQGSIDNVSCVEVGQDWTFGTGWSVGEDKVVAVNGNSYGTFQGGVTQTNKKYKVTYTIEDYISGTVNLRMHTLNLQTRNSNGTFTEYFTSVGSSIYIQGGNNFNGSITNISVKEVGQNWDFGGDWEFVNGTAEILTSTNSFLIQSNVVDLSVKNYKLQYEVITTNGSNFKLSGGNSAFGTLTIDSATVGVKTIYLTSNGTARNLQFFQNAFRGSIDNISVIEITDDTNLPRINYEGFSYQDALGSEEVLNGGFDTDSDWDLGTGWSISGGEAVALNSASGQRLTQDNILQVGKIYKLTYEVKSISSGGFKAFVGGVALQSISNIGVYTETMTTPTINDDFFIRTLGTTTGSIDNVSVKEYLGQEVVPDSGCGHYLWEPQSTNTIISSNTVSTMNYSSNITKIDNSAISPDSTFNAMIFTPTATGGIHRSGYSGTAGSYSQNDIVTFSGFIKANGYNFVTMGGFFGQEKAVFNISNGTLVSQESNVINTEIVKLTNDWYRVSTTYTFQNSIGNGYLYAGIYVMDTETGYAFTGDGVSGVYGYGFQAELGTGTSYIPTEGSTVTRNQDVCNNGGSLASINSTEGVLYAEIAALTDSGSNRSISISDGTNTNQIVLRFSNTANQITAYITDGGSITASLNNTLSNSLNYNKIALKYKLNDVALWVNGVEVATDINATMPSGFDVLKFSRADGANNFFAKTKALAVWKEALSDEELTELTTI